MSTLSADRQGPRCSCSLDERELVADAASGTHQEGEKMAPYSWHLLHGIGQVVPTVWAKIDSPSQSTMG